MTPLLEVNNLHAGYGRSEVLHGVSFGVGQGEVVTLLGRNGMGKSTTLKCVMGIVRATAGDIRLDDRRVNGCMSYEVARRGLGFVPEGRDIFPTLTVEENLRVVAANRHNATKPYDLDGVYAFFPRLRERRGNMGSQLSGGEQQMLAIGRALMTNPRLLVLDEVTEGLAPLIRTEIWRVMGELSSAGMSMIIVDKNLGPLLELSSRHYVLENGCVVWSGTSDDLIKDGEAVERHLTV